MVVVVVLILLLLLLKSLGVFVENFIYSVMCVENMCFFGFLEYFCDILCIEDKYCSVYMDLCVLNFCDD